MSPFRALRPCRTSLHRTVRFSRKYNGTSGPHTTYFQPPPDAPKPQRRILRSILLGTTLFGLGLALGLGLQIRIGRVSPVTVEDLITDGEDPIDAAEKLQIIERATAEHYRTYTDGCNPWKPRDTLSVAQPDWCAATLGIEFIVSTVATQRACSVCMCQTSANPATHRF